MLMRFKRAMRDGAAGRILALILSLTAGSAPATPLHCHLEREAAAGTRLEVWAQTLTGRNGLLTAHSTRQIAVVVDHRGTVLETLALVAMTTADRRGGWLRRSQWVRCTVEEPAPTAY